MLSVPSRGSSLLQARELRSLGGFMMEKIALHKAEGVQQHFIQIHQLSTSAGF
jgi:hypothetical protein